MERITHADDLYIKGAGAQGLHLYLTALPNYLGPPFVAPTETAGAKAVVHAFVNDARWVATCPDCGETQIVSKSDPRMLCWDCKNFAVEGRWRPVAFPSDLAAIEAELLTWPTTNATGQKLRRHWTPGEKLADLHNRKLDHLRPSVPRIEDLTATVADQVTAALTHAVDPAELPEVTWDDDERTKPLVLLGKRKRKAKA